MEWWHYIVLATDGWLVLGLGPWLVTQVIDRLFLQSGSLERLSERRDRMVAIAATESGFWPAEPRSGGYGEADREAAAALAEFGHLVGEVDGVLAALAQYHWRGGSPSDVLLLRSWGVLGKALAAWPNLRAVESMLSGAQAALDRLLEQRRVVETIPERIRASLSTLRAEAMRLLVLSEAEQETGTKDLEELAARLRVIQAESERGLAEIGVLNSPPAPDQTVRAARTLDGLSGKVDAIEKRLSVTTQSRQQAEQIRERIGKSLAHLSERWSGLKTRGVAESELGRAVEGLARDCTELDDLMAPRTLAAYQAVSEACATLDSRLESVGMRLDSLDELVETSRQAVAGDLQRLTEAQEQCERLATEDPFVEPDWSETLIERANEAYMEAEKQRVLGTAEGYRRAIELAAHARKYLQDASQSIVSFPEQVAAVREDLSQLSAQVIGDWRLRAERVREDLSIYAAHWAGGLAGRSSEAVAAFEQVEINLERLAPNIRYQRRFRQSEIGEGLAILESAAQMMARGQALAGELEQELLRIEELRQRLEDSVERLNREVWPQLEQLAGSMLPVLRERYQNLLDGYREKLEHIVVPAEIDYDHAVNVWLPDTEAACSALLESHERDLDHYARLARDRRANLERKWGRLVKLNPLEPPLPQENVYKLERDLGRWRVDVERHSENLPELRDVVTRRADDLEQRTKAANDQIEEGRTCLRTLGKQFSKHAQGVHVLRTKLRDLERDNEWSHLDWDWSAAEQTWGQAAAQQRASQASPTLVEAVEQMGESIGTAEEAEQAFGRAARDMEKTLQSLGAAERPVLQSLARAQQWAERSEEQGESERTAELRLVCDRVTELVDTARGTSIPEEALQALQEAQRIIDGA